MEIVRDYLVFQMNRYKKSANTRRNEWIRSRPKPMPDELKMHTWVSLPVSEVDNTRGDLNKEPLLEVELRKQEADYTNKFLILNNQPQRYEKKSEWINQKWRNKFEENS